MAISFESRENLKGLLSFYYTQREQSHYEEIFNTEYCIHLSNYTEDRDDEEINAIISHCHAVPKVSLILSKNSSCVPSFLNKITNISGLYILGLQNFDLIKALLESNFALNINSVTIRNSDLTDIPVELSNLSSVQSIDVSENNLQSLPNWMGNLTSLHSLNVSGNNLRVLPDWIGNLTSLQSLNVSSDHLQSLPEQMSNLTFLQSLNVSENNLSLPNWISNLTHLQSLNISGNNLQILPDWIGDLASLKSLSSAWNSLQILPDWIGDLTFLQSLDVSGNRLQSLPNSMGNLTLLQSLNASGNSLLSLPDWVGNLTSLQFLDISGNSLQELPNGIENLIGLQSLNVSWNQLKSLPKWINNLNSLQYLNLAGNNLHELPDGMINLNSLQSLNISSIPLQSPLDWIENLNSLQSLDISGNNLRHLPGWIANLNSLQSLSLSGNSLRNLPDWMRNLTSLQSLDVSVNSLQDLPDWMRNLTSLQSLSLSRNSLQILPKWITKMKNLKSLDISRNDISFLPDNISDLSSLIRLNLSGMELKQLPESLFDLGLQFSPKDAYFQNKIILSKTDLSSQQKIEWFLNNDRSSVHAYFEALKGGSVPLKECKVIFLGYGNAGKTHTIQRILNGGDDSNISPRETSGIKIDKWKPDNSDLTIHFWDFGGQEIMHSMHRCFLTQRCLYVIVLRKRFTGQEYTMTQQALYWLECINECAPNSKVLIITNREVNDHFDVNRDNGDVNLYDLPDDLKAMLLTTPFSYCAIKEAWDQFDKLTETILTYANQLEIVNNEFPKSWDLVRKEIDLNSSPNRNNDPIIAANNIDQIFHKYGITDYYQKKDLLDCLNDLGVCFSYYEDQDYKLLDPEWLTNAIYSIINSSKKNTVNSSHIDFHKYGNGYGQISHRDIRDLLNDDTIEHVSSRDWKYTESHVKYILTIMRKYELSYPLENGIEFIPAICPYDTKGEVYNNIESFSNCLQYYIKYERLLGSIIHRLMVACSKDPHMIHPEKCYYNSFKIIDDKVNFVTAIIDTKSTQDTLYITIYGNSKNSRMWLTLNYLREKLHEINMKDSSEYIITEGTNPNSGEKGTLTLNLKKLKLLQELGKKEDLEISDDQKMILSINIDDILGMVRGLTDEPIAQEENPSPPTVLSSDKHLSLKERLISVFNRVAKVCGNIKNIWDGSIVIITVIMFIILVIVAIVFNIGRSELFEIITNIFRSLFNLS